MKFNRHGELVELRSERVLTAFRLWPHKLRVLDLDRRRAWYWSQDAGEWPLYERCAPLRKLLAWWLAADGVQIIHAGAVGTPDGGVVLAGKGGAGKSTTSLAAVRGGLRFAGDDVCALDAERGLVHGLYNTAKLKTAADVARFPELAEHLEPGNGVETKAHLFLHRVDPAIPIERLPVRAVLVPTLDLDGPPRLEPATGALALAALSPSTLELFPADRAAAVETIARFVERVPVYRLYVGPDLDAIGRLVAAAAAGEGPDSAR